MNSWSVPDTHDKAGRLARHMAKPLTPGIAMEALYGLVGNERLWNMFDEVRVTDSKADVRPLVAAHLEEMCRWLVAADFTKAWEPGVREKVAFIAERFEHEGMPPFGEVAMEDDAGAVIAYLDDFLADPEDGSRDMTAKRTAPGVYAVHDANDDRVYRVECRFGHVTEALGDRRDFVMDTVFPSEAPVYH